MGAKDRGGRGWKGYENRLAGRWGDKPRAKVFSSNARLPEAKTLRTMRE